MTSLLYTDQYVDTENHHRSAYVRGIDKVSIPGPHWCFSSAARRFTPPAPPTPQLSPVMLKSKIIGYLEMFI